MSVCTPSLDDLICPRSSSRLVLSDGSMTDGMLENADGELFPILGGVPFLVADISSFLSTHHDAILASLAERGLVTSATLRVLASFNERAPKDQSPFAVDFLIDEVSKVPDLFRGSVFDSMAAAQRVLATIGDATKIVEVGPGGGHLTTQLCKAGKSVVAVDRSLRALLSEGTRMASILVAEAEELPFRQKSADALVALNVIDLLDDPLRFLERVADVVVDGGKVILSTPDPWAWEGERELAEELLVHAGFELQEYEDDLWWPRLHHSRELQLYRTVWLSAVRRR